MVYQVGNEPDPSKRIRIEQGKLIKQFRKMRGLTQAQLAAAFDPPLTEMTISQWENGRNSPRPHLQLQLAKILDFPWSAVFSLDRFS